MKKLLSSIVLCSLLCLNLPPASTPLSAATSLPPAGSINLNEDTDDFIVSDVMTYDEIVQEIATDSKISMEEAKEIVGPQSISKSGKAITYRTLSKLVTVTSSYKPTIKWYCQTDESGSFHGIVKIVNSTLNRNYGGVDYKFVGELYSNLENGSTIYYLLNGDFYKYGTQTISGGAEIPIGGSSSLSFNVSYASNHYKYSYISDRFIWR